MINNHKENYGFSFRYDCRLTPGLPSNGSVLMLPNTQHRLPAVDSGEILVDHSLQFLYP